MKRVQIAPSILSADFSKLGEEIKDVDFHGADWIHVDVMDGHFVPNITIGSLVVRAIRPLTKVPLDVHLMIADPEKYVPEFIAAGADMISFHVEATPHVQRILHMIKSANVRAAVALTPATPLSTVEHILPDVDMILLMTVNPGFGGQVFIPQMVEKTAALRELLIRKHADHIDIEVDGGIAPETVGAIVHAGANLLVAGSSIFGKRDRKAAMEALRVACPVEI
ncbi:ribulose-phosphate 3-epimerase [Sulfoacidibacillus thermotolerans]|uniref:Ribulose-phosphate 3-epimerase n=1 Tax=Sulfoacidibacillus thermotolerans TaxID=1765684 RepID=A0A2U3D9A7_SULT2|nr:ribulose-phosphate 3-epimerase [Sulfoacidibacillus thermotolerans]PWI57845.1 ribulose-phosphate 3-epimerase [Sulfoacidibacillus thermotolerans]